MNNTNNTTPIPSNYNYDPITGQTINHDNFDPVTGQPVSHNNFNSVTGQLQNNQPINNNLNNKKDGLLWKVIAVIFFIFIGISVYNVYNSKDGSPKYDENNMPIYITDDDYDKIWTDTNSLKGYFVKLEGIIIQVDTLDDTKYIQMCTNSDCDQVFFAYYKTGSYSTYDKVKVTGYILKSIKYTTKSGSKKENPLIMATKIEDVE